MGVWANISKRAEGTLKRREDNNDFWESGSYTGTLDSDTKELLHAIHDFKGFAPFLPKDILKPDGDVRVILDKNESRSVTVKLAELEEELHSLEEKVRSLKDLLEKLRQSKNANGGEIERILCKIKKLESSIRRLTDIISKLRKTGQDSYTFEIPLLGYYVRTKEGIPEIHLMMETLMSKDNPLFMTGITFVHELMHAFFDNQKPYVEHPLCRIIEEPIAEYGMLCFMEMFERYYPEDKKYNGILDVAKEHVEEKQYSFGVCHYGFGGFLFEDRADFGVDWVSLFRSVCPALIMNAPEVKAYESMISPVRYPRYERACECKLYDALKPKRFFFECEPDWRGDGSELYFQVKKSVADSTPFMIDYPPKKKVMLTFYDKSCAKLFTDIASVQSRGRFRPQKVLTEMYSKVFGMAKQEFAFYEKKPSDGIHPAEWVAYAIDSGSSPE